MSGGAYNYSYRVVEDFADALESGVTLDDGKPTLDANSHVRLGFAAHLRWFGRE